MRVLAQEGRRCAPCACTWCPLRMDLVPSAHALGALCQTRRMRDTSVAALQATPQAVLSPGAHSARHASASRACVPPCVTTAVALLRPQRATPRLCDVLVHSAQCPQSLRVSHLVKTVFKSWCALCVLICRLCRCWIASTRGSRVVMQGRSGAWIPSTTKDGECAAARFGHFCTARLLVH